MKTLWNKKEVIILIYGYYLIEKGIYDRDYIINEISNKLRKKQIDMSTDNKFRNKNGISMKLGNIDYLFSKGKTGFKNYSKLEYELFNLFLTDKNEFNRLLKDAKIEYDIEWEHDI